MQQHSLLYCFYVVEYDTVIHKSFMKYKKIDTILGEFFQCTEKRIFPVATFFTSSHTQPEL